MRLPPDPFDLSEASDLSVLPLRLSVMREIISQQRRSATARWACSAMRMADPPDAPDASDGISNRHAASFLDIQYFRGVRSPFATAARPVRAVRPVRPVRSVPFPRPTADVRQ